MALEKLGNIIVSSSQASDVFDSEMTTNESNSTQIIVQVYVFKTLASLTSEEESCRKQLAENKKIQDELFSGLKSGNRDVKFAACACLVSLLRSDKYLKSILIEAGDFHKDLLAIFINSDNDQEL